MNNINFSILDARTVVLVAEHLNLAKVSKIMGSSPNTLTINIGRIERKVNKTLFLRKRGTAEIELSQEGKDLLPYFKFIVDSANLIDQKSYTWSEDPTFGNVHISSSQTIIQYLIEPYLPDFLEKHPNINLDLSCLNEMPDGYKPDINELALVFSKENDDRYEYIPFHRFPQKFWASASYIERNGTPKTLEDLRRHVFLKRNTVDKSTEPQSLEFKTYKTYNVSGFGVIDRLCERGVGIMCCAEEMVKIINLNVEEVLKGYSERYIDVYLKVNKSFLTAPVCRYMVNWIFQSITDCFQRAGLKPLYSFDPYPINP